MFALSLCRSTTQLMAKLHPAGVIVTEGSVIYLEESVARLYTVVPPDQEASETVGVRDEQVSMNLTSKKCSALSPPLLSVALILIRYVFPLSDQSELEMSMEEPMEMNATELPLGSCQT